MTKLFLEQPLALPGSANEIMWHEFLEADQGHFCPEVWMFPWLLPTQAAVWNPLLGDVDWGLLSTSDKPQWLHGWQQRNTGSRLLFLYKGDTGKVSGSHSDGSTGNKVPQGAGSSSYTRVTSVKSVEATSITGRHGKCHSFLHDRFF